MTPALMKLSVLFLFSATSSLSAEWPLMKCSRRDPNINRCLVSAARQMVPVITKGLPAFGVRQLEPMNMGEIRISVSNSPVLLNVHLTNTYIHGTSRIQINSAKVLNDVISVEGFHKELILTANYNLLGKLFLVPINSEGFVEIHLKDLRSTHAVDFHNYPRTEVGFKINHLNGLTFTMSNARGGTEKRVLSKLLNDNWKVLFNAFKPEIEREIQRVYTEALRPLFEKFHPSIFLPQ